MSFDVRAIRQDFPILQSQIYGHPLVYLDNGATTQKPRQVVEAMVQQYYTANANVHRGVHHLSVVATDMLELSRETVRRFINAEAARNEGIWWTSVPYYWPSGSDKMAFYAYWPYSANCTDGFGVTDVKGGAANEVGPMKLHFKVNTTDISQQQDLMYAVVQNKTFDQNNPVNLNFRHALTAVNFELGADIAPGYIKKIELLNIGVEGDYTVGQGWTTTATGNITLDFTAIGGYSTKSGSPLINNNYGALLMIPQSFSNSTPRIRLYINDSDDGTVEANDHNLYKELQLTDDWKAGTTVTYKHQQPACQQRELSHNMGYGIVQSEVELRYQRINGCLCR